MKHLNIILILVLTISIFSCKDSDRDEDVTTNSCTDYAFGQGVMYDAFKLVHQAALSSRGITAANLADTTSLFGCDTLIVDTLSNPMTITIQFNGTCNGNDMDRSGSITASFSSKYDALGCMVDISFNNYTYGVYPIGSGTISYIYNGLNGTYPAYSYNVNSMVITNNDRRISWSGNQTLNITAGETTAQTTDDTYSITGSASGVTYQGNDFTALIDTDLMLSGDCKWVSSGNVTVSPENKNPRALNFGSSCDAMATVSIYSLDYEIEIP